MIIGECSLQLSAIKTSVNSIKELKINNSLASLPRHDDIAAPPRSYFRSVQLSNINVLRALCDLNLIMQCMAIVVLQRHQIIRFLFTVRLLGPRMGFEKYSSPVFTEIPQLDPRDAWENFSTVSDEQSSTPYPGPYEYSRKKFLK